MKRICKLEPWQVFVFGSNLAGIHGAGAALDALSFGAIRGRGHGHFGQTYAIPTKDSQIRTLPLENIRAYVETFKSYAGNNAALEFLLTPIGCGLAGYSPMEISPLFSGSPYNVVIPEEFKPRRGRQAYA